MQIQAGTEAKMLKSLPLFMLHPKALTAKASHNF